MKKLMIAIMLMFSASVSAVEMDCFTKVYMNGKDLGVVGELTVEFNPNNIYAYIWNSHDDSFLGKYPSVITKRGVQDGMQSYRLETNVNGMHHKGFCTVNGGTY
ncbi:hypothetical protein VPHD148_0069 [Vibrio phage D148]